jgi:hypothetical protein
MKRGRLCTFLAIGAAYAQQSTTAWPDTYVGRLQALAVEQTLNAQLLASRSSTLTLEAWCREHALAKAPAIVAELQKGEVKAPTAEQRERLQVSALDDVRYRKVRLRCGDRVLSIADNWYVPGRLTVEMNRLLETTRTPFGKVVQALGPYRQTFEVKLLWSPLPDGWERGPMPASPATAGALAIPAACSSTARSFILGSTCRFRKWTKSTSGMCWPFRRPADRAHRTWSTRLASCAFTCAWISCNPTP